MPRHKEQEPWLPAEPGDLIEADKWNEVQQFAKAGIASAEEKCDQAVGELREELDDIDAAKLGGKTPEEWADEFAAAQHDHEGSAYRRFIKRFDDDNLDAFLDHGLGRYPLVDVYELKPAIGPNPKVAIDDELRNCKLLFYYGHNDADDYDLRISIGRDRRDIGIPFGQALEELGVEYDDDDTIEDVLNDLWRDFSRDPNDELDHCTTPWVDKCCGERRTVEQLKDADQWADLRLGIRPVRCPIVPVCITHVDYESVYVAADGRFWRRPLAIYQRLRHTEANPYTETEDFGQEVAGLFGGAGDNEPDIGDILRDLELPEELDLMFLLRS